MVGLKNLEKVIWDDLKSSNINKNDIKNRFIWKSSEKTAAKVFKRFQEKGEVKSDGNQMSQ